MSALVRFRRARLVPAALALGVVALARCASTPPAPAGRTVAISFDGLGGERLNRYLAEGALPDGGFKSIAERGLLAGRAIDVTPSLTPAAHIAALAGAPPSKTGIVANQFRLPGMPFGQHTTGFAAPIETETLWEAARRQGRRAAVLLYPGADGEGERRRGDFGLIWPEKAVKDSVFVAVAADQWAEATSAAPRSFSPPKEAHVTVAGPRGAVRLRLVATDTTDDATADYDLLTVLQEGAPAPASLGAVALNGWFPLAVPGEGGSLTSWCRLEGLAPDLSRAEIYVGAFYPVPAYPEDFRRRLESAAGGFPGPPDYAFLRPPRKDEAAHEEQAARLAEYLTRVLVFTIREERWDLLVGYQPLVDEIEHAFEPGGPRGGSAEAVLRAFRLADRSAAKILASLRPDDTFLFFSDHGMVPLVRSVDLEKYLEGKGWGIARASGVRGPAGATRVQVCSTSGIAHVYLDPALGGTARADAAARLLVDLRGLSSVADDLVDMIVPHAELKEIDLDNARSGDVVVLLRPGSEFRSGPGVLGPPGNRGGHGYRNVTPALDASFGAFGPGVEPGRPETVSLLEVASRAARALGISPPRGAVPAGR